MLLEIICCRKCVDYSRSEDEVILEEWVYDCYSSRKIGSLIGDEKVEERKVERMVKIGIWCVQYDPSLRPTMKKVLLMLEGTVEIPIPPCPSNIPKEIGHLNSLESLDMASCGLNGLIPKEIGNMTALRRVYLGNNALTGVIPGEIGQLNNLEYMSIDSNKLTGPLPLAFFNMSRVKSISLRHNTLKWDIAKRNWEHEITPRLYLINNTLTGVIPEEIGRLENLVALYMKSNNFIGHLPPVMFNMKSLKSLSLHKNALTGNIPKELFTANIESIDLSNNHFQGFIPPAIATSLNLSYLDLANNNLSGSIPSTIGNHYSLVTLILHSNNFIGVIPSSICKLSSLKFLHLSNNSLHGSIPRCLAKLSISLQVLHLKENNFDGLIPPSFPKGCALKSLNLNSNKLQGTLPRTLVNCGKLQVLDVGSNAIQDAFPFWMEDHVDLRVLVLRDNRFNGSMLLPIAYGEISSDAPFGKLQVFDISHNGFSGPLPTRYLTTFPAMMNAKEDVSEKSNWFSKYEESLVVVLKGTNQSLVRILKAFITIDMSRNKFSGKIPDSIGNLNSLKYLNLSHNSLTGKIPSSLGSVKALESLDLSSNRLNGEIPRKLTMLNFLSTLNLSVNDLVGEIPQSGGQFPTFDNSSFIWNLGLCGFPLTRKCKQDPLNPQESEGSNFVDGLSWRPVVLGYGCGFVIGVSIRPIGATTGSIRMMELTLSRAFRFKHSHLSICPKQQRASRKRWGEEHQGSAAWPENGGSEETGERIHTRRERVPDRAEYDWDDVSPKPSPAPWLLSRWSP
ncbi:receptor-like protein 12 [Salvia hispanica]|uniref:receptor-like protein 12 n=1 Tax=Salvia hispanica TaxID=49212 RepID=UPI0020092367|nr:receptor-like protein 12 [Salvia hispanica]